MREQTFPECRWVTVVDVDGRRRLEMRWQLWIDPTPAQLVRARPVRQRTRVARAA